MVQRNWNFNVSNAELNKVKEKEDDKERRTTSFNSNNSRKPLDLLTSPHCKITRGDVSAYSGAKNNHEWLRIIGEKLDKQCGEKNKEYGHLNEIKSHIAENRYDHFRLKRGFNNIGHILSFAIDGKRRQTL